MGTGRRSSQGSGSKPAAAEQEFSAPLGQGHKMLTGQGGAFVPSAACSQYRSRLLEGWGSEEKWEREASQRRSGKRGSHL